MLLIHIEKRWYERDFIRNIVMAGRTYFSSPNSTRTYVLTLQDDLKKKSQNRAGRYLVENFGEFYSMTNLANGAEMYLAYVMRTMQASMVNIWIAADDVDFIINRCEYLSA